MADMSVAFVTAEEHMSEEDEEFMLDNFVTFFIAGKCWVFFFLVQEIYFIYSYPLGGAVASSAHVLPTTFCLFDINFILSSMYATHLHLTLYEPTAYNIECFTLKLGVQVKKRQPTS